MTNKRDSALPTITGAGLADGDLFRLVDISDTTDGASGSSKVITKAELASVMGTDLTSYLGELEPSGFNGQPTFYDPDSAAWDDQSWMALNYQEEVGLNQSWGWRKSADGKWSRAFIDIDAMPYADMGVYAGDDDGGGRIHAQVLFTATHSEADVIEAVFSMAASSSTIATRTGGGIDAVSTDTSHVTQIQGGATQSGNIFEVFTNAYATTVLAVGENKLGFFDTAAVTKETGVAVSTAAIHAALVRLGLIGS